MKAKLIFDLTDLDDRLSHEQCMKANDMALVIWEFVNNSRRSLESEIEENNIDGYETLDVVFKRLYELLDEHHINIDELMI